MSHLNIIAKSLAEMLSCQEEQWFCVYKYIYVLLEKLENENIPGGMKVIGMFLLTSFLLG